MYDIAGQVRPIFAFWMNFLVLLGSWERIPVLIARLPGLEY
ncbi:hypothetical protein SOVF_150520 [Spinacia oleracea]|nr:hypothetical protein SOVF_150520 [Spinacia oleracea]